MEDNATNNPLDGDVEHENEAAEQAGLQDLSAEELLEQAQANTQAAIIATVGFLYKQQIPLDQWATSLGKTFANAWDEPDDWDADEFLDAILTNYRSLGAEVISTDFASDRAAAVVTGFPDPDLCATFGVAIPLVAHYNDTVAPLAERFHLHWQWHLDEEQTTFTVTR